MKSLNSDVSLVVNRTSLIDQLCPRYIFFPPHRDWFGLELLLT